MIPNSDLQKWQQTIKGIESAKNNLSSEDLSAFQALTKFIESGIFDASESGEYIRVMKKSLAQHGNNRLLKVHLTNFIALCELYFKPAKSSVSKQERSAQSNDSKQERSAQGGVSKQEWSAQVNVSKSEKPVIPEQPKVEYYYYDGREEIGPLGIGQLKTMGLTPDSLVWREGLVEWKPVKDVEELGFLIRETPPPVIPEIPKIPPISTISEKKRKKTGTGLKKVLIIIGIALVVLAGLAGGYFMFKDSSLFSGKSDTDMTDYSLIPVSINDETWGYINRNGDYEINALFSDADFFSDGLAKIISDEGKTGYINKNGDYAIQPIYKNGTAFNDGLAFVVEEGGVPTCIDKNGETQFVLKEADYVFAFSEGLAMFATEDGEYGFVDKNGNTVIDAQFDMTFPFIGDYACFRQEEVVGFINKTGKITIPPQFMDLGYFSEGKAPFFDGSQWGYINTNGSYAINAQFESAGQFKNGLAAVQQGGAYGYINKAGKMLINPQFDEASDFSDGLAAVKIEDKYGYISKNGKTKISPKFEYAGNFYKGTAPVFNDGKWGFINKTGQYIVNPLFSMIKHEVPINTNEIVVESDYFDISEFFKWFIEREDGNTFDGIKASTTLEELTNHPIYGACLNAREEDSGNSYADCNQETPITNDISIKNILFYFDKPIYKIIETYNRGIRSTRKEIDLNTKLVELRYELVLSGKAWEKSNTMISALKTEMERHYGQPMEAGYFLKQDVGKLSFCIVDKGIDLQFGVNFNGGDFK